MTLKANRESVEYGNLGVKHELRYMKSDNKVFWSDSHNSFVVVARPDKNYDLLSINGIGEIRWKVESYNRDKESNDARNYFFEI